MWDHCTLCSAVALLQLLVLNHCPLQVEPTAIAALNLNWPGSKLTVCILDDGKRPEMARLVRRLAFQCRYMQVKQKGGKGAQDACGWQRARMTCCCRIMFRSEGPCWVQATAALYMLSCRWGEALAA